MKPSEIFSYCKYTMLVLIIMLSFNKSAQAVVSFTYYYAAPQQAMINNFGVASLTNVGVSGYRAARITASNLAQFRSNGSPNMVRTYNNMQSGHALRTALNKILKISNERVDIRIFLFDDRTAIPSTAGICKQTVNSKIIAWPCAGSTPVAGDRHRGDIIVGEEASNIFTATPGGWKAWEGVILHESLHTQFVGEVTKWGDIRITYGADGGHWISEIMGDQAVALNEGLGNFFSHAHNNPTGLNNVNAFFGNTGERYALESWSVLAPNLYRVPHTEHTTTPPYAPPEPGGRYAVRTYKWLDIPGFYLLYSESTAETFYAYFWDKVNNNRNQAFDMIIDSAKSMWRERRKRYLTYAVNRLSLEMEQFTTTPQGQTARAEGTLTSSMYPFALLDLVTHFGMTEQKYKQDYDRHYPDRNPRAYTQYWSHRDAVKTLVQADLQANPIRIQQAVAKIHEYFQQANTIL